MFANLDQQFAVQSCIVSLEMYQWLVLNWYQSLIGQNQNTDKLMGSQRCCYYININHSFNIFN